jgi:hypothetical protein
MEHNELETRLKTEGYILLLTASLFLFFRYVVPVVEMVPADGIISGDYTSQDISLIPEASIVFSVILISGILGLLSLSINEIVLDIAIGGSMVFFVIEYIMSTDIYVVQVYWWSWIYTLSGGAIIGFGIEVLKAYHRYEKNTA